MPTVKFWELPLKDLDQKQWEALCDGCARCCLLKIQDEDTDEVFLTSVVCRHLDQATCRCRVYSERTVQKPECIVIKRNNTEIFSWLPDTCAYRLRSEGQSLPDWHPLLVGSKDALVEAGLSVSDQCTSEEYVHPDDLADFLIECE